MPRTKLTFVCMSKLKDFLACKKLYYLNWIRNVSPMQFNYSFGIIVHTGLEKLLKGMDIKKVIAEMEVEVAEMQSKYKKFKGSDERFEKRLNIALGMLIGYHKYWKPRNDKSIKHVEMRISTPLTFVEIKDAPQLIFTATVDYMRKLELKSGKVGWKLGDHKSPGSFGDGDLIRLPMDPQLNLYTWALKQLGYNMQGAEYDILLKKTKLSVRYARGETFEQYLDRVASHYLDVDPNDPKRVFRRYPIRILQHHQRMALADAGAILANLQGYYVHYSPEELLRSDIWPRNTYNCDRWGRCPYFSVCLHGEKIPVEQQFPVREARYPEDEEEIDA